MARDDRGAARELAARLTPGNPQPALTAEIAECSCPEEARGGLYLVNGDWEKSHVTVQALDSTVGAYWHALVHRHEPDFGNSKYWLRQCGASPVHGPLLAAAEAMGHLAEVSTGGVWDGVRFTDWYADAARLDWTRELDRLETAELLRLSLELP